MDGDNNRFVDKKQHAKKKNKKKKNKHKNSGGRLHYSYNRRVTLEVSSGVDTTDFAKVARDEHLNKMELEALKIQRNLEEVVGDLGYFKRREERHRDTNESTNGRVMWFSLVSMGIIVAIGSWQLLYLRRFFTQKKLI